MLEVYELASSQRLNMQKTTICFSSNTKVGTREQIGKEIGARGNGAFEKYLGLPSVVGRSKYNSFRSIKERIWARISNWKNHFLSQIRKEILIKTVLQVVPTYAMSVFKLPQRLCKKISILMAKFLWGHMREDNKIQWKK